MIDVTKLEKQKNRIRQLDVAGFWFQMTGFFVFVVIMLKVGAAKSLLESPWNNIIGFAFLIYLAGIAFHLFSMTIQLKVTNTIYTDIIKSIRRRKDDQNGENS
jgi:hypothetical protein